MKSFVGITNNPEYAKEIILKVHPKMNSWQILCLHRCPKQANKILSRFCKMSPRIQKDTIYDETVSNPEFWHVYIFKELQ